MDIHKPKPFRNFKEFGSEILTIVIGILIALGLEQAVESYHLHQKAKAAEDAIRDDVRRDLIRIFVMQAMEKCGDAQIAALQEAIVRGDTARATELVHNAPLLPLNGPLYQDDWKSAQSPEIAERIGSDRMGDYAFFFTGIGILWSKMDVYYNTRIRLDALATPGAPRTPEIVYTQLQDVSEMVGALHDIAPVGRYMASEASAKLGVSLSDREGAELVKNPAAAVCEADAKALEPALAPKAKG